MDVCAYPAGGQLCLSVGVAASSVLNRYGAALPANDLAAFLTQLSSSIEAQLQFMRVTHQVGTEAQPFIDQLCAALETVCNSVPDMPGQEIVDTLVREIRNAITDAVSGPHPIDSCCKFAYTIARDAYRRYANTDCASVAFAIKPAESDLSWHGVQSKVSGTTTLEGRPANTSVELTLSLRLPWRTALNAIPYVLVHECVAHAFRGPCDSTEDSGQGSEFADGWMDRVALLVLLRALRTSPISTLPWPWSAVEDLEVQVGIASKERLAPRDPDPTGRLRSKWEVGTQAALALEGSINGMVGDRRQAEEDFLRLSVLLNASTISLDARDHLARQVYFRTRAQLEEPVRAWLINGLPPPSLLPT
jgi:hypothetical protein